MIDDCQLPISDCRFVRNELSTVCGSEWVIETKLNTNKVASTN